MKRLLTISIITMPLLSYNIKPFIFVRDDIKIESLLVLPPISQIAVINNGNKLQIDKELSDKTFFLTLTTLQKSFPDSVKTQYFSADSMTLSQLTNFVSSVNKKINSERLARKYQIPDSILNLFDTSKINFVFGTFNIGFKRGKNNLVNQHLASEIADLMIGYNLRPLESSASMSCFILDLRKKNILYFERDLWKNKDPTDIKLIQLQLSRIITHYFI